LPKIMARIQRLGLSVQELTQNVTNANGENL